MGKIIEKIKKLYENTVSEVKKCTWPSKNELVESTVVVIAALAILIGWVFCTDMVWSSAIKLITSTS